MDVSDDNSISNISLINSLVDPITPEVSIKHGSQLIAKHWTSILYDKNTLTEFTNGFFFFFKNKNGSIKFLYVFVLHCGDRRNI